MNFRLATIARGRIQPSSVVEGKKPNLLLPYFIGPPL